MQAEAISKVADQIPPLPGFLAVTEERKSSLAAYMSSVQPKTIMQWLEYAEVGAAAYAQMQKLANFVTRALPLIGLLLVWVWVSACSGEIRISAKSMRTAAKEAAKQAAKQAAAAAKVAAAAAATK